MKQKFFCAFLFLILSLCSFSPVFAGQKSDAFSKTKRDAENAFAELDGRIPEPEPEQKHVPQAEKSKETKKTVSISGDDLLPFAVLKGTGTAKDEKTAKISALAELGSTIVVNVSSRFVMSEEEKDGKYSQLLKEDISIKSNVFLKNVYYTKPVKIKDGVSITAFMTEKSVINTINYLVKTMPSDIETLQPEKFDDVLTMIYLAYSLLYAVSDNQVSERQKYIDILNALKDEIEKLATYGSVYFSVKSGVKGKIEVEDQIFDLNKKIFLKPGNYKFSVKLDGYKNFSGSVNLSKGDKKFVEIPIILENSGKQEIFLRVESPVRMIDDIEKVLLDFGIVPTQKKELPHQVVVVVKTVSMKVDNYEKYTVSVDVHTFKNGEKFKITHYEHKPFFATPQNRSEKVAEESRKVSVAVVKKFLSSIDLQKFFDDSK